MNLPSSGELKIQGESPGKLWHRASARYASGIPIPVPSNTPEISASKETVALWTFGGIQDGEDWLFVGTEEEFRKFKNEKTLYKYSNR